MPQMKLAKSKESEINNINLFFRELSWLADEKQYSDLEYIDFSDFELLSKFNKESAEDFIEEISRYAKSLFWEKLIMNTQTLLENCADPNVETVEFNDKIQKGFALQTKQFPNKNEYPEDYKKVLAYYELGNKTINPISAYYIKGEDDFFALDGHKVSNVRYWYEIPEQSTTL